MCGAGADAVEACLDHDGRDWASAGYDGKADFVDACETWAWEQVLLARDAGEQAGAVAEECVFREDVFETGECAEIDALMW